MTDNLLFPGRPNYTGPTAGVFAGMFYDKLVEFAADVLWDPVGYVQDCCRGRERELWLHNMIYMGERGENYVAARRLLDDDYARGIAKEDAAAGAARTALYAQRTLARRLALHGYNKFPPGSPEQAALEALAAQHAAALAAITADYDAKLAALDAKVLSYIREHIPDCFEERLP